MPHAPCDGKLKISQLRALVAIAERGNFSSAALDLELTQSTISHAIATLEEELGVVLLFRGRHGATLTPIGEQIIEEARQVLHLLGTIRDKANLARTLQSGQVRIGSVRSIATQILPELIVQFRAKFPEISVVITDYDRYADVEQALQAGKADVGLTALPTKAEFETWELLRDEFVALLPPSSLYSDTPLSWEELANYPMILNLRSVQNNKAVHEHLLRFGQTLKIDYEVREDSTVLSMVKQGLGATIMARLAAEPIPDSIQVKSLPVPLERVIGVAILTDTLLAREVFAFLDILKDTW